MSQPNDALVIAPDEIPVEQARELDGLLETLLYRMLRDEEQVCCHDVTMSEYRAMRLAAERCTPAMQDIVEVLGVTKSGATRIVDRLEEKGYARRERDAVDGRVCCVRLTPKAERLLGRIEHDALTHRQSLLAAMKPSAREGVLEALRLLERVSRRGADA